MSGIAAVGRRGDVAPLLAFSIHIDRYGVKLSVTCCARASKAWSRSEYRVSTPRSLSPAASGIARQLRSADAGPTIPTSSDGSPLTTGVRLAAAHPLTVRPNGSLA